MIKGFGLWLSLVLLSCTASASLEFGVGTTSGTGGRLIPALSGAYVGPRWAFFGSSTGVHNNYYFQSSYQVSAYRVWQSGTFLGGKIDSGFGGGLVVTARAFQDEGASSEDRSTDFAIGPALRVHWSYFDSVYIGLDVVYGLRNLNSLASLAFQDYTSLSLGAQLW